MFLLATVLSVQRNSLLVFDLASQQRVRVISPDACRFRRGDIVRIQYDGVMTASIPPQISAQCITAVTDFPHRC